MFTQFSERNIVFHDRDDVRLIYAIVTVDQRIEGNSDESKRQRRLLDEKKRSLERILSDLARGATSGEAHREVVNLLRSFGYSPSPELFQELADNVRYQRGLSRKFREGIIRSGRYLKEMEAIFVEKGCPPELALIPHVESSFQYRARSRVGATGIWQIVRSTGKPYLRMNAYLDQRLDPLEATRTAASILKGNFDTLGNWPLAITAYNYGRNGMLRAVNELGPDLYTITQEHESKMFGFASKNFYAEFLAAIEVHKNHERYFGPLETELPLNFETVKLANSYKITTLDSIPGLNPEVLRTYNPQFTSQAWRQQIFLSGSVLRLPVGTAAAVQKVLSETRPVQISHELSADGSLTYKIRPGDSLTSIAATFGTSVGAIKKANGIANSNHIQIGRRLRIPGSGNSGSVTYTVKYGDTLFSIAHRFKTSLSRLLRANGIVDPNHIALGQVLMIPR
jgi:membrane-bound lytic murein transglycosylase D